MVMLIRGFSSAIVRTLTFYHFVIFLAVVGVLKRLRVHKALGLLAAIFHLLAGAICNLIAGLTAATLNLLLAAWANRAATLDDVTHAITASLDFNVAVLF